MMITIVTVWLCLITHVACDVLITVNNNGSDNDKCCVNGTCPCSSLSSALHNVSDNTEINITSESVTLHDIVGMGSGNLSHITITGNGATIMCNNTGGVYCESCSNITIMGITWYQCSRNDPFRALAFINPSSEVLIQHCTFQNCPVYIRDAKGKVSIEESNFITDVFDFSCSHSTCIGLYISYDADIVVAINNSKFNGSGCTDESGYDCNGVWIEPSNNVFKFNRFLFKNINFSNYDVGLNLSTNGEKVVTELSNVYVYNNQYGIFIQLDRWNNDSSVIVDVYSAAFMNNFPVVENVDTVNISSATFVNNGAALILANANTISISSAAFNGNVWSSLFVNSADTVSISSSTFASNNRALFLNTNTTNIVSTTFMLGSAVVWHTSINACTINISSVTFIRSHLTIDAESDGSSILIADSYFYSSEEGVRITGHNSGECLTASIVFTNVIFYNITGDVLHIETENTILPVMLNNVSFISNYGMHTLFINIKLAEHCSHNVSIQLANCTFDENYSALDHVVALSVIAGDSLLAGIVTFELSNCNFNHNFGGKSIVYVNLRFVEVYGSVILENSTFSNNKGTALYLAIFKVFFKGNILFKSNSANDGAAVYIEEVDSISFEDDSNVQFINNSADLKGGAMYISLVNLDTDIHPYCDVFNSTSNTSNVSFTNNSAGIAGNSIYFSIPKSCQIITNVSNKSSLLYHPKMFEYLQPVFTINPPVVTSPYNITLYPPAIAIQSHNSDNDYLIKESKMLGEPIQIVASVFGYFNKTAEPVTFSINCKSCGNDYRLSMYQISVHNQSIYDLKVFPAVSNDIVKNTNISVTFLSALTSVYRQLSASLSIELSSCRAGYLFDFAQRQCVCYPYSDLVHCKGDFVEIKIGYWIGNLTKEHHTSSVCPNNYCSSEYPETSPGYYRLRGKPDDQCSSYRTGVACGECKSGYTLAYDFPDCINIGKCSVGMTILVIVLTILYWIAIVAVVFGLMYFQFQISSGYAYGIIYYYSIVDILLVNHVSKEVFHLVIVLSSFAKLTPQLFGQLCLVEGLSGIDQQFIHYCHALAVSLILLFIVLVTRYSPRLT